MKRFTTKSLMSACRLTAMTGIMLLAVALIASVASAGMLTDLQLSIGQLAQPFSPVNSSYFAVVPETEPSVTIVPVATDGDALITVSINGGEPLVVASGTSSPELALEIGTNVILVRVSTDEASETYRISIPKRAVRFQQGAGGYQGAADTQINQAVRYVDHNLGSQHKLEVGYTGPWARDQKYILLRFEDLSIPADATVTEATVNLWYFADRVSSGYEITAPDKEVYMHRIRIPWTEGQGGTETSHDGSPAQGDEVTWNSFMGEAAPFHFDVLDSAVIGVQPNWYSFDATGLVKSWLDGSLPNYGVLFKTYEYPSNGDDRMNGTKQFRSSEYSVVDERPYLSIVYTQSLKGIALDMDQLELAVGQAPVTVTAFPRPLNAEYHSIEWTTSNASVVRVADGVVTPMGTGSAVVTATISDGAATYSAQVQVTVK